ncbi:hypothetical protein [Allomuricauda sp. SCSIO 65647]|uniref:hypothetical protein n=1 Tax=Allomuricauda sp. SCSIO 65647 TaxID=2908843 RepID=UPI001F300B1C|nr:hypothetical protein [Muricauda sp. SCSIO 65647]UJH69140.1 hypothetical protein L0P89_07975 [Muricauda sp. SCSIO 65647]
MNSKLVWAALLLFVMQWGNAQKMDAQKMADYQTETMTEQLDLSEEQQKQIAELNLEYSEKQATLMNQEGSMFSKMDDMKQIAKDKKAELKKVLSKEQMKKYEDDVAPMMRKKMRKKMRS